jgi:serine protease DegQ
MGKLLKFFTVVLIISPPAVPRTGFAGVLKSLDEELTSLVEKTEPYLVTVRGQGPWKNLIATGIVHDNEGYLITSSRVYDADHFEVRFKNGESYPAEKIGVDRQTGLAVLKIDVGDLKEPRWGEASGLKDGAWILVVGNSYGIPATVNFGILSGRTDEGFLELGVDVSPGSSGGAVLDTDGRVVGVVIAVETDLESFADDSVRNAYLQSMYSAKRFPGLSRKSENKAIAVPAEQVKDIADQLIKYGEVKRGFLGISQRNLPAERRREYGIEHGVLVVEVVEDSPAEKAGLKEGDIILAVGDDSIENTAELFDLIRSQRPGDKVTILYYRDGEKSKADVTLAKAKEDLLLGAWDIRGLFPKIKADSRLMLPDMGGIKDEISRLESEIDEIRKEIEELRKELKD